MRRPFRQFSYLASCLLLITSIVLAARAYPDSFDWQYTVISALASAKHNPAGYPFLSVGLALSLLLLWPSIQLLRSQSLVWQTLVLKAGVFFGVLMCLETFIEPRVAGWPKKLHELLALLCFLNMYIGIISISISRIRLDKRYLASSSIVLAPLLAIGISQLSLYIGQRDLGWVDQSWRELGVPLWQSFAFWQWLALASLWISLGVLSSSTQRSS